MHWGQGDRSEFIWEATLLARSGAVCVLVDAPWARPQPWKQVGEDLSQPDLTRKMYIQNTVDLRRAVDMLLARGDVDPERIAYVGHSFGATQGGLLAGVERRIKTFVLMGGLPSLIDPSIGGARKFDDYLRIIKERVPDEMWRKYCDAIAPLTPATFVAHAAPSSVLMQFATDDSWISRRAAETYFAAATEPKAIKWYRSAHDFNNLEALADRALWLKKEIGIRSIVPLLQEILNQRR
jgi:dienelactone hydrolase